jgi:hypothetical protein
MTEYQNTKYDFKKYLLDNLNDAHQEELIFWKKSIPLPIDLLYKIFDESNALIGNYCGHIISLAIMECYYNSNRMDLNLLNELPSSNVCKNYNVSSIFDIHYRNSKITSLINLLKSTFNFRDLSLSEQDFANFICHDGRKYRRLYVPRELKNSIIKIVPNISDAISVSNGDMFGNIVADYLEIYRSGFSDAFAAIFNKLIDFQLTFNSDSKESYSNHHKIKVSQLSDLNLNNEYTSFKLEKISDGALWEPAYVNAKIIMRVNVNHPYWNLVNSNTLSPTSIFQDILSQLNTLEIESVKDSQRKILENIRYEISRALRVEAEFKS